MRAFALFATLLVAACSGDSPTSPKASEPTQEPQVGPAPKQPTVTEAPGQSGVHSVDLGGLVKPDSPAGQKMALGAMLFFDPRLSKSGKTSCSTCHLPELAWTDGKALSTKDDGTVNKRHTPTLVNCGYCENLYWDGRAPSMEKNVVAAWKGQMSADPVAVAATLAAIPDYATRFQKSFNLPPDEETIGKALAAFVRMQRGLDSAFDRWQAGDDKAVSPDVKAGYDLFLGKAGCAVCHAPPIFTDKIFHNTGIGMDAAEPDKGRGAHLKDPKFDGYFKTPSLRDVARTAPYFHDGSIATLEEAVRFMASGGRANPTRSPELMDRKLSDLEINAIVAFLKSLSSETTFDVPTLPK
ncbi:MAG: cytochrome c peroxidase [Planctomycetota bacterium]